ncbi:MAG: redoxin domain-containing protein [Verrucomicrobiae bacterium]|nr:redoxin domain-containing protein [Verrucomicrobiae bacterium]
MAVKVGDQAPDIQLKSKNAPGEKDGLGLATVKISDNKGKKPTVLLFFPMAFTGICTKEMCDISSGIKAYEDLGAAVYGISVDSPFAQGAWAEKEKISLPLLSDLNKQAAKAYGAYIEDLAGIGSTAARAAFVIGKDGKVKYAEVTPTIKELPNFEKVKAALQSA